MGPDRGSNGDDEGFDPFEGLTLDESFIRSAPIREPAAHERERAARDANLSRLLADEAAQREHRGSDRRRFAATDLDDSVWEDWDAAAPRRSRHRPLRIVALVVLIAVVAVYVMADYVRSSQSERASASSGQDTPATTAAGDADMVPASPAPLQESSPTVRPDGWPPLDDTVSDRRLGTPDPVPGGGGRHTFVLLQDDGVTPVGYDPCRPVRYRTRPGGPEAGDQMVREAVAMVSAATGLQFIDEGTTEEAPSDDRPAYQPERYGERWAPVLIAWSDAEESPLLGRGVPDSPLADVAGYAGSQPVGLSITDPATDTTTTTGLVFVTGKVVLDGPDLAAMLERPDGYARARAVIAHELAHLVGLGHVDDPAQLMHPETRQGVTGFGPGDLEGMSRLGTLDCVPQI